MKQYRLCLAITILVAFGLRSQVRAEEFSLSMDAIEMLPTAPTGQVIGANPADPKVWPATFTFKDQYGKGCTSTAIGERVILTAAHCVPEDAVGKIRVATQTIDVSCKHHPNYPGNASADFALCLSSVALPKPGSGFEKINRDQALPQSGQQVTLLGFGCILENGTDHSFGTLYQGSATVQSLPTGTNLYTLTKGGAAVCFGDSGGGAYVSLNNNPNIRRLIAVNSKGDISENSWLSSTATDLFLPWAEDWAGARGVQICGMHESASFCRQ